jgi:hypothetical protein
VLSRSGDLGTVGPASLLPAAGTSSAARADVGHGPVTPIATTTAMIPRYLLLIIPIIPLATLIATLPGSQGEKTSKP